MNVYEELKAALKIIDGAHALEGSRARATWPIGEGRVTTEEFESWQLGPDLTSQYCPAAARHRHSKARGSGSS
jgi:hypothetical protein